MNQNTSPGGLDRDPFQPEQSVQSQPGSIRNLLECLTAIYREVGLPESAARKAAMADLQCELGSFALAA